MHSEKTGDKSNRLIREPHLYHLKYILVYIVICSFSICTAEVQSSENTEGRAWGPPLPSQERYDWIQLSSGEWLKGNLEGIYGDKLEFDSDKLGYRRFKWKDVKQVLSNKIYHILFEDQVIFSGYLQVIEEKVFITITDQKEEFNRDQIVAIIPGYSKEIELWKTRVGFGLNISKGNTDQTRYNMKVNLRRRTLKTGFELDYSGNYVSTDNEETSESQRISSFFDILNIRDYFLRVAHAEYYRDPFQNINYRVTVGSGVGLELIANRRTNWDIKGGPAYQITRFESVEQGRIQAEVTFALDAGTYFDTELTGKLDLVANYNFNIVSKGRAFIYIMQF